MLAGLSREEKQKLDISDASKYQYLIQVNNLFILLWKEIFNISVIEMKHKYLIVYMPLFLEIF